MTASNRWLVMVGATIALVVVAGIAVTVVAGGERRYAEGTPERLVQDYLRAVSDRDTMLAYTYLTPDLAKRCENGARDGIASRGNSTFRATLEKATVRGDRAEVRARITQTYGTDSPFNSGESTMSQAFQLVRVGGAWRLSESPWPLYCPPPPPVAPAR